MVIGLRRKKFLTDELQRLRENVRYSICSGPAARGHTRVNPYVMEMWKR